MKKLTFLICIFLSMQSSGQSFTSFDLLSHSCSFMSPPPANNLTYNFKGDTLDIQIIQYGHCCQKPSTTIDLAADTIKFSIQDTSSTICACDCKYEYNYRLYGFTGNLYVAQAFSKTYIIDRTLNSIQTYSQIPTFEKKGNILKINHLNKHFKVNIYDLKGNLIHSLKSATIDLTTLNLKTGIYLFQVRLKDSQVTKKIFIE